MQLNKNDQKWKTSDFILNCGLKTTLLIADYSEIIIHNYESMNTPMVNGCPEKDAPNLFQYNITPNSRR